MSDPSSDALATSHKDLQKELRRLAKLFSDAAKPKLTEADFVKRFEAAIGRIPERAVLAAAIDEVCERARQLTDSEKHRRRREFDGAVATFIRQIREQGESVREYGSSWRVGRFELELDPDNTRARALYNQEPVTGWTPAASHEDLPKVLENASRLLAAVELSEEALIHSVHDAYNEGSRRSNDARVPARVFLEELRLAVLRQQILDAKPGKKLKHGIDFPLWAAFYNLDRYRALGDRVPAERRVSFETGDQQTVARHLSIRLGGLSAESEYQKFSFVKIHRRVDV